MALFQNGSSTAPLAKCNEVSLTIAPKNGTMTLPLCIEIPGGRALEIIPAGVRLPHKTTQLFSTADAHQLAAEFHIFAGARPLVRDNIELGRVRIRDVKWAGAGQPKLEISFKVSGTGVLTITAANLDRKRTEMLASITTPVVTADDVRQAERDAENAREQDAWIEAAIDEMLTGYGLLDDAYERYAIAKKKMDFAQKRQYKQARKRLVKALNVLPPESTKESVAELKDAIATLIGIYIAQKPLQYDVMAWYK